MNEQLFIDAAKIRADRRPNQHPAPAGGSTDIGPRARRAFAFAAALLINLAVFATLQWSAANARYAPAGEVVITQLDNPAPVRLANN